jgi:SAM-dependent methyltransferase
METVLPARDAFERYQFKPFTGSSHSWAIHRIEALSLSRSARVLDVGPGSGAFGRHLKASGVEAPIAIEIDAATRAHVSPHYRAVYESLSAATGEDDFDLVLLLDVLEHMADPFQFLQTVAARVKPNGTILISVPNITHWSSRLMMATGRFDYTDRGILDRTHLHFFTRRHFDELLCSVKDFKVTARSGSLAPAEFVLPEGVTSSGAYRTLAAIRRQFAHYWPALFAYQHLGELRR